jgi:hypothetical protein
MKASNRFYSLVINWRQFNTAANQRHSNSTLHDLCFMQKISTGNVFHALGAQYEAKICFVVPIT